MFTQFLLNINSQESYYLVEKMIENELIEEKIFKSKMIPYFAHYAHITKKQITCLISDISPRLMEQLQENYDELSKDNWELHKHLIKEGVNPNKLAKIIRNDEIEKLQEISSQNDFKFNQYIIPSLYERCSFINKENVTLIDYAAFFGSVKCFKYLLINGAKVNNTGKYAIAGGNEEIVHLCEQNHSSFEGAYKTAIEFHRNDVFKYVYENKFEEIYRLDLSGRMCITYYNFEIFEYLIKEGMTIDNFIVIEAARMGNIYLIKHFLEDNYQVPSYFLVFATESGNIELVNYILEQKGIDVNGRYFNCNHLIYQNVIWNLL